MPSIFWEREFTVDYDFILVDNFPARTGTSSAIFVLNSASVTNPLPDVPSTLTYTQPLKTVAGKTYILSFFYTLNNTPVIQAGILFSVSWNSVNVLNVTQPAVTETLNFLNGQVQVTATGTDTLIFQNGPIDPHQFFLDDISLFAKFA